MKIRALAILILCMLTSCITNDGDIGPIYGMWRLTGIERDGTVLDQGTGTFYFKFQNDIVCITEVMAHGDFINTFGTWDMADNKLSLEFTHSNDTQGSENGILFNPAPQLHIPGRTTTIMHINQLTGRHLHMHYTNEDGVTYTYYLDKVI